MLLGSSLGCCFGDIYVGGASDIIIDDDATHDDDDDAAGDDAADDDAADDDAASGGVVDVDSAGNIDKASGVVVTAVAAKVAVGRAGGVDGVSGIGLDGRAEHCTIYSIWLYTVQCQYGYRV